MPIPRKNLISTEITSYYHCTSRCVRRMFLCGTDPRTKKSYEYRRGWIETLIERLAEVFAIDVCAYAIMENHYHIVLNINTVKAVSMSDLEVCMRWHARYKGNELTRRFATGEVLNDVEREAVQMKLDLWRQRLCSISWFMRALNEPIARMANKEDNCTGAFWQSRFASQALLTEKALASCLAYVELNPVRADIADTPENSDHTSIQHRINALKQNIEQPRFLAKFVGYPRESMPTGLPFDLKDFIELVDWTGRVIRDDKRGDINHNTPPIFDRLEIDIKSWKKLSQNFERQFKHFAGDTSEIKTAAKKMGYKRTPGLSISRHAFL